MVAVVTVLGSAVEPVELAPDGWSRVEGRLEGPAAPGRGATAALGGGRGGMDELARRRRGGSYRGMVVVVLAAAAVVLVLVRRVRQLTVAVQQKTHQIERMFERARAAEIRRTQCQRELARLLNQQREQREAMALLQEPTTQLVALAAKVAGPHRASAVMNLQRKRAYLLSSALPAEPDKDYELWIIRGGEKIAAGLLSSDPGQSGAAGAPRLLEIDATLLAGAVPDALAVTLEPRGGGPTPRGPVVLFAAMSKG
jgi:anti-sigma-K factor RskA